MLKKIGVVGLGYVGLPLALAIANKNYKCFGIDTNKKNINELSKGYSKTLGLNFENLISAGNFKPTNYYSELKNCHIVIYCLPTPLNGKGNPDLSILLNALKKSVPFLTPKTLIVIESTVYPGFTRNLSKLFPKNEIAFSPERIDPLNKKWNIINTPKLVAGLSELSQKKAIEFYSTFIDSVIPCSSLEIAEMAKLLENSFRLINISFINEMAIICQKLGIEINEVVSAAATKPYGFMPFNSSIGVGGHCIPVDPIYLSHVANQIGVPSKFIELATKVNDEMPKYFVKRAREILGKLKNKKILVLGVSYKPNISDIRETPVKALIDELRNKGAEVWWHDEIVKKWRGEKSSKLTDKYDLAIVATTHDYFDFSKLGRTRLLFTGKFN